MLSTLLFSTFSFAFDTIPHYELRVESIQEYHSQIAQIQKQEFDTDTKYDWLAYIPAVGFSPALVANDIGGFDTKIRPTVSLNSSLIFQILNDRKAKEKRQVLIVENASIEARKRIEVVELKVAELRLLEQDLSNENETFNIDSLIFQIQEQKYDNGDILPLDYLRIKKSFVQVQQRRERLRAKIKAVENEIRILCY